LFWTKITDPNFRREDQCLGFPDAASEAPAEFDRKIVNSAANPLLSMPKSLSVPDLSKALQARLDMKARGKAHQ
jgi:hypothetical protein